MEERILEAAAQESYEKARQSAFRGEERVSREGIKRKGLKHAVYFGGLYCGKGNGKLWREVKEYIEKQYGTEAIEKI